MGELVCFVLKLIGEMYIFIVVDINKDVIIEVSVEFVIE